MTEAAVPSRRPIRVKAGELIVRRFEMTRMANHYPRNSRSRPLRPFTDVGGCAAAAALRPLTGAVGAVAEAGISLEQRAVDRLLETGELERLLASARGRDAIDRHVLR